MKSRELILEKNKHDLENISRKVLLLSGTVHMHMDVSFNDTYLELRYGE